MKATTLRTFIDVHTWVGLIAGFALFIAFYTGAITVFTHELHEWDDVAEWNAPPDSLTTTQSLLDAVIAEHPGSKESLYLQLPGEHGPRSVAYWYENLPAGGFKTHEFRWVDGKAIDAESQSQLAAFIYRLHYTAGLPGSWGIYVLGFVCILYGVALVTGVVVYAPGFLRDLFALRVGSNLKRLWQDAHNVVGVLSLPFHVIFAWSGAILCIGTLLLAPFQFLVFDGKLMQILSPDLDVVEAAAPAKVSAPMLSVEQIIARAQQAIPGMEAESINFTNSNDANAQATLYGSKETSGLVSLTGVAIDANSGEVFRAVGPGNLSAGTTFYRGLATLHFGEFGNMTVRWLYFVLGMAGAFLFFTGNLLWVEARRNRRGVEQTRSSRVMAQITLGVALGCIAGVSASFIVARLLSANSATRADDVELAYYVTFFAAVVWSLLRAPVRGAHELLLACAALTLAIPFANAWSTGMNPWRSVTSGHWVPFAVDALSVVFAWGFWRVSRAVRFRGVHGDPNSVWARPAGKPTSA